MNKKERSNSELSTGNHLNIHYSDFNTQQINLTKFIIKELKIIAKYNKLKISGRKNELIIRITEHFDKNTKCEKIQKHFRRHLVIQNIKLRGPALFNRNNCINDKDFISLEHVSMIPWSDFFSYIDDNNNIYGFDINSFVQYIKHSNQTKSILNPYNREPINSSIVYRCISLYNTSRIICNNPTPVVNINVTNPYSHLELNNSYYNPTTYQYLRLNTQLRELYLKITYKRKDNLNSRIQNIFIEFDRLGNYTNSSWLNSLTLQYFPRLLRTLYDIWMHRANLSTNTKKNICCIFDPFQNILQENMLHILHNNVGESFLQNYAKLMCVTIFENLTYTGIDEEHCKLGAMYCLMSLTRVSQSARIMLPWLYEAIL